MTEKIKKGNWDTAFAGFFSRMMEIPAIPSFLKTLPFLVLCLTLTASLYLWKMLDRSFKQKALVSYTATTDNIVKSIIGRMHEHEQVLLGGVGLFNTKQTVTRTDWHRYISALKLDKNHPGITGVGYSIWLSPADKYANIRAVRAEGFPAYTIRPEGRRPNYTSIIYLEPFDGRNQRAFGYDMYSDPIRHAAMDKAVDGAVTAIAAGIILVQETEKDTQNGILMYVPVYKKGMPLDNTEQRRKAISGFVYSPIRINDFIYGTMGRLPQDVSFDLSAGEIQTAGSMMFSSIQAEKTIIPEGFVPVFTSRTKVEAFGQTWIFSFRTLPVFAKHLEREKSYTTLIICILTGFLLSFISYLLLNTRNKALTLAEEMTLKVREGEDTLRLILNSTAEAIYGIDLNGNCTFCNQTCLDMLGYARTEELLGRNMHDTIHHTLPDGRPFPVVDCRIFKAFQAGEGTHVDDEFLWRKDGSPFPAEYWSYPQFMDGKVIGAVVTFIDITERKKVEEALKESRHRYQGLVETLYDWIWEVDADGVYTYVSPQIKNILGYEPNDILGKTPFNLMPPEEAKRVSALFTELVKEHKAFITMENINVHKDGRLIVLETNALPFYDSNGMFIGYRGNDRDITERKQTEERLNTLSTRLQLATRAGGVGILDYDIVRNSLTCDDQMLMLYGIDRNNFNGTYEAWRSGLHPDDAQRVDGEFQAAIAGTKEFDTEFKAVWPDGSVHNIRANAIVQRDENGKALHMIGTNWDITIQKQEQVELLKANAAKSEFLANMSHEIRTPMNGVIGMTQLLLGTPLNTAQREYAEILRISGESLLSLINDILDYSKIEAGKLDLESIDFNISNLLKEIEQPFVIQAQVRKLKLLFTVNPGIPGFLRGDPNRLRQILNNLLSNALKFTNEGEVAVTVKTAKETADSAVLNFSIRDTGIGIPRDRIGFLFKKFSQIDASTTRKHGGTGLGLAISKELVERMGGSIDVESVEGKGSEFRFSLPFRKGSASIEKNNFAVMEELTPEQKTDTDSFSLLVAEDNSTNRIVLKEILSKIGFSAEFMQNGREVLDALDRKNYDLIFMDIQMPVMDGYETTQAIRRSEQGTAQHIPVIAMTAHALTGDRDLCISAGMDDYITKPVEISKLISVLNTWLHVNINPPAKKEQTGNAAAESTAPAVFNIEDLLQRLQNDRGIIKECLSVFREDTRTKIKELQSLLEAKDIKMSEITAHAIKGSAANIGGEQLRTIAYIIENASKKGDLNEASEYMDELRAAFNELEIEIEKWEGSNSI